jgi:antitoxin component of RelBE/YafQ-DinJ toxin-antitoxin module
MTHIMYSLRIDKKLIDRAKKEAKKLGLCTSAFIRQAIIDKVSYNNKLKGLEERITKLENKK